ncbi:DUF4625 domain-containing protein [Saccharicrinis aurantiacus]|uniref:DUF4625 domain-containing protein n=1 Tax=Saccharicrinis aurantiacus TaxID=1849719 RepID=UPI002491D9E8|nr:DUF4625 domain-containing protein [Saccharicrinis aurantiacus]
MKRNLLKFLPFLIGTALILSSCGGDSDNEEEKPVDETKPVIETPAVPTADEVFMTASKVAYKGTFTDDTELKSVVFTLSSLKSATGVEDDPWETQTQTVELSGTSDEVDQEIFGVIPDNIYTGDSGYQLSVVCEDAAGNKSAATNIKILLR